MNTKIKNKIFAFAFKLVKFRSKTNKTGTHNSILKIKTKTKSLVENRGAMKDVGIITYSYIL